MPADTDYVIFFVVALLAVALEQDYALSALLFVCPPDPITNKSRNNPVP